MAYEKLTTILELARALASTAEGLTLDEMCREIQCERRTLERMRDAIREVFPQLEEIVDHPTKRFRIPGGLDGFFQDPSVEELSDLGVAIVQLRRSGAKGRAESLAGLDRKIRAAMRLRGRHAAEVDVDALLRAELIAVRAGPRPHENPEVMTELRKALLGMKMLRFTYRGGTKPGASRRVIPYGIIFGRMNYLIGADAGTVKPKNWRLDRIDKVKCLETAAARPENFDLAAFATDHSAFSRGHRRRSHCESSRTAWKSSGITAFIRVRRSRIVRTVALSSASVRAACRNWPAICSSGATRSRLSSRLPFVSSC